MCEEGTINVKECEAEEVKDDIVGCFFLKTSEYPGESLSVRFYHFQAKYPIKCRPLEGSEGGHLPRLRGHEQVSGEFELTYRGGKIVDESFLQTYNLTRFSTITMCFTDLCNAEDATVAP